VGSNGAVSWLAILNREVVACTRPWPIAGSGHQVQVNERYRDLTPTTIQVPRNRLRHLECLKAFPCGPHRCIFPKTDAFESVSISKSSFPALTTTKAKFNALNPVGVISIVPLQVVVSV
jgi:hypothetical protein